MLEELSCFHMGLWSFFNFIITTAVSYVPKTVQPVPASRIKELLHDQTKFHKLFLKLEFVKPNPSVPKGVITRPNQVSQTFAEI